jgi:cation transport ATPase
MSDPLAQPVIGNLSLLTLIMWILATPVQFGIGARFYIQSYKALKHGAANMSVLVALGTTAAYGRATSICLSLALLLGVAVGHRDHGVLGLACFWAPHVVKELSLSVVCHVSICLNLCLQPTLSRAPSA